MAKSSTTYQPTWKLGATRTIRVPVAIADQVTAIARQIDSGEKIYEQASVNRAEIDGYIDQICSGQVVIGQNKQGRPVTVDPKRAAEVRRALNKLADLICDRSP